MSSRITDIMLSLQSEIDRLAAITDKYGELIYAVGMKHPGETRHETALRYIMQAEAPSVGASAAEAAPPNGHVSALADNDSTKPLP